MPNIIEQDAQDALQLRVVSLMVPAYRRYLAYHINTGLHVIMCNLDLACNNMGNIAETENRLARIKAAAERLHSAMILAGITAMPVDSISESEGRDQQNVRV